MLPVTASRLPHLVPTLLMAPLSNPTLLFVAMLAQLPGAAIALAEQSLPTPPTTESVDKTAAPSASRSRPQRVVARRATTLPTPPIESSEPPPVLPKQHHAWARFRPGAWRRIKITTESFDANGRFLARSSTSQTETLRSVEGDRYTLSLVSIVEVGGKKLRGESQEMTFSLLCNDPCEAVEAERLDTANISLDGAVAPVERWQLRYGDPADRRSEIVFYSADRSPYVLRRETTPEEDAAGPQVTMSVTRVDAPLLLDGGIVPTSHVSIVTHDGPTRENRFEVRCDAVPGGLVSASSVERDASGRRVRWSAIELEAYGETEEKVEGGRRWRPLQRLRNRDRLEP